jgi:hypothetical protein
MWASPVKAGLSQFYLSWMRAKLIQGETGTELKPARRQARLRNRPHPVRKPTISDRKRQDGREGMQENAVRSQIEAGRDRE